MPSLSSAWRADFRSPYRGGATTDFKVDEACFEAIAGSRLVNAEESFQLFRRAIRRTLGSTLDRRLRRAMLIELADFIGALAPGRPTSDPVLQILRRVRVPKVRVYVNRILRCLAKVEPLWRVVQVCVTKGLSIDEQSVRDRDGIKATLVRCIHYSFLLHVLTLAMANSADRPDSVAVVLFDRLQASLERGPKQTWSARMNTFEWVKAQSINEGMKRYMEYKRTPEARGQQPSGAGEQPQSPKGDGRRQPAAAGERKSLHDWCGSSKASGSFLSFNILEAGLQDVYNSFDTNAEVGKELMLHNGLHGQNDLSFQRSTFPAEDRFLKNYHRVDCWTPFPVQYNDLYTSWDMCFIYDNFDDSLLFMAKFLNPAVLCFQAKPALYMHYRVLALYLHIHMCIAIVSKKGHGLQNGSGPVSWKNEEIAQVWGSVNKCFAATLKKVSVGESSFLGRLSRFGVEVGWNMSKYFTKFVRFLKRPFS